MSRKKIGLALGSGAFRGLAHIGVIQTLEKHNIPIDFLAGASAGAWVAAHYSLFQDTEKLIELAVEKKREKLYSMLEISWRGGFIQGKKFKKMITEWLKGADFSQVKIPIMIIATDLLSGYPVILEKGSLAKAVQASMAIPTLFKPVAMDDKVLVDGGVSNPVPDDIVRKMGADIVIAVNLDNFQKNSFFTKKDLSLTKTAGRSLDIMRHYLARYSIQNADFVIEPFIPWMGFDSWKKYFMSEVGMQIVQAGASETEKIIPALKKALNG